MCSESEPFDGDESLNLVIDVPSIPAHSAASFQFAYLLSEGATPAYIAAGSSVHIHSPKYIVSGAWTALVPQCLWRRRRHSAPSLCRTCVQDRRC